MCDRTLWAHTLGCTAANGCLDLFARGQWRSDVPRIERLLRAGFAPCAELDGVLDVRVRGAIGAVDLKRAPNHGDLIACFVVRGVWIKPFGQVVYLTRAFVASDEDINRLTGAVARVLLNERLLGLSSLGARASASSG